MQGLRLYQTQARFSVNRLMNSSRHPVLVLPTGTGKTKTAVGIIEDRVALGGRVYVLVPQIEIFTQWVKDLNDAGLNPGMIKDGKVMGVNRKVYVVMPLTLINMLAHIPQSMYPTEIITDECHHSEARSWQAIYDFFPKATRLGLTATPQRTDGIPLSNTYTDIVSTIDMKQAIEAGYLSKPLCIVPEEYAIDVPVVDGDYDPKAQAKLLGKPEIIGDVIDLYGRIFVGKPVIVACCSFEHAQEMTESFCNAGWNFKHIHSNLAPADRAAIIKDVRSGAINGVCTVGIGIEGMDIPGLYGLIWLRRTLSLTIYLQFCGRVLRPLEGKTHGIIVDPVGNVFIHGLPELHRTWSLDGTTEQKVEHPVICPECGTANPQKAHICTVCGAIICDSEPRKEGKKRTIPSMHDGKLVAVGMNDYGVQQAIRSMKAQAAHIRKERQAETLEPQVLPKSERMKLFRENMLKPQNRENFKDAIKILKGDV